MAGFFFSILFFLQPSQPIRSSPSHSLLFVFIKSIIHPNPSKSYFIESASEKIKPTQQSFAADRKNFPTIGPRFFKKRRIVPGTHRQAEGREFSCTSIYEQGGRTLSPFRTHKTKKKVPRRSLPFKRLTRPVPCLGSRLSARRDPRVPPLTSRQGRGQGGAAKKKSGATAAAAACCFYCFFSCCCLRQIIFVCDPPKKFASTNSRFLVCVSWYELSRTYIIEHGPAQWPDIC